MLHTPTSQPLFIRHKSAAELLEKQAAAVARMPDDDKRWPAQVLSEMHKQLPFLSRFDVDIEMTRIEPEAGYAIGYAMLRNKTGKQRAAEELGKPTNKIRVPVIVADRLLQPFHVFEVGGKTYPLTQERLESAMMNPSMFDGISDPPGTQSLLDQIYPPFQHRQGYGMMSGDRATTGVSKISSAPRVTKTASGESGPLREFLQQQEIEKEANLEAKALQATGQAFIRGVGKPALTVTGNVGAPLNRAARRLAAKGVGATGAAAPKPLASAVVAAPKPTALAAQRDVIVAKKPAAVTASNAGPETGLAKVTPPAVPSYGSVQTASQPRFAPPAQRPPAGPATTPVAPNKETGLALRDKFNADALHADTHAVLKGRDPRVVGEAGYKKLQTLPRETQVAEVGKASKDSLAALDVTHQHALSVGDTQTAGMLERKMAELRGTGGSNPVFSGSGPTQRQLGAPKPNSVEAAGGPATKKVRTEYVPPEAAGGAPVESPGGGSSVRPGAAEAPPPVNAVPKEAPAAPEAPKQMSRQEQLAHDYHMTSQNLPRMSPEAYQELEQAAQLASQRTGTKVTAAQMYQHQNPAAGAPAAAAPGFFDRALSSAAGGATMLGLGAIGGGMMMANKASENY
jgi:hypothetical protein